MASATADLLNEPSEIGSSFVGDDGVLVELGPSWSDEAMLYEPRERPGADQRA